VKKDTVMTDTKEMTMDNVLKAVEIWYHTVLSVSMKNARAVMLDFIGTMLKRIVFQTVFLDSTEMDMDVKHVQIHVVSANMRPDFA